MFYRRAYERAVREHERERQAWEAERKTLLDRIMLLAGNPWTPPPMPEPMVTRTPDERLTMADEAFPDDGAFG